MITGRFKSIASRNELVKPQEAKRRPETLRIGLVTHYMPPHVGGIELIAEALFSFYTAAGCEVRWVASRVPAGALPHEPGRIRVRCWNGLERRFGVPWPLWGTAGAIEIARLVRWANVIHVHDCLYLGSAFAVFFARRARKPVLLSQHIGHVWYSSAILNRLEHFAYQTLGRSVLRHASHVVLCTPAAEDFVKVLLGKRAKATTAIPYGIDTARFRPPTVAERIAARRNLGLPELGPIVLFTGRLVEKKGVDLFLEVSRQLSSYHFFMVGDGPLRPVGMNNLTWLPFVPPEQMETVYRAADAFLLPSYGEGFPLAVLEALATGLPVIVLKGGAFAKVLEREGACLAAEATPIALCKAVSQLREAPQIVSAMAARSRDLAVREYSLEVMKARYLNLIGALASSRL